MIRTFLTVAICAVSLQISRAQAPKVIATASMIADIAQNIAGTHFDVDMIVPIGSDPHLYEPTPGDAKKVVDANMILTNGLTFEGWLDELIDNSGTKADNILVTEGIDAIESEQYKGSFDPHAWMSAANGIIYAQNITKAFQKLDPVNAADYSQNLKKYTVELNSLHTYIGEQIKMIKPAHRFLITSHDAFQYFGRAYDITLESILGISTEAEVQTSDIFRVSNLIKKNNIPAIFIESTINPKLMQQLAEDRNTKIGGKLYADSLGDEDSPASTYVGMLKYNVDTIVKGLTMAETVTAEAPSKLPIWSYILIGIALLGMLGFIFLKLGKS